MGQMQAGKKGTEEMSFADLFEMDENSTVSKVGDVIMGTIVGVVDDHAARLTLATKQRATFLSQNSALKAKNRKKSM